MTEQCRVLSSAGELHWIVQNCYCTIAFWEGQACLCLWPWDKILQKPMRNQHLFIISECELGKSIDTGQETPSNSKVKQGKNTFESCSGKSENEDTWCLISICTLQKQKLKIEHVENDKLYVFGSAVDIDIIRRYYTLLQHFKMTWLLCTFLLDHNLHAV